jgi:hypothetical protein
MSGRTGSISAPSSGAKAFMISGYARRPVPIVARQAPDLAPCTFLLDNIALDSEHDYDSLWAKCLELKVAPTAHCAGMGRGSRTSPSNYVSSACLPRRMKASPRRS